MDKPPAGFTKSALTGGAKIGNLALPAGYRGNLTRVATTQPCPLCSAPLFLREMPGAHPGQRMGRIARIIGPHPQRPDALVGWVSEFPPTATVLTCVDCDIRFVSLGEGS
jgi:hypothetical protein